MQRLTAMNTSDLKELPCLLQQTEVQVCLPACRTGERWPPQILQMAVGPSSRGVFPEQSSWPPTLVEKTSPGSSSASMSPGIPKSMGPEDSLAPTILSRGCFQVSNPVKQRPIRPCQDCSAQAKHSCALNAVQPAAACCVHDNLVQSQACMSPQIWQSACRVEKHGTGPGQAEQVEHVEAQTEEGHFVTPCQ